jgi:antitoxin component of RelBE/YafQ-DinJ toxin-antitoxin module
MKKTFFPIITLLLIFTAGMPIYANPPNAFDIISPKDLVELNTQTVMFQYEDKGDPDGDTLTYHIWIRNYKNEYYSGPFGNTTSNTFQTVLQDDNMKYSWYVIAEDTSGETTTSTNTGTFAINIVEETPLPFDLILPEDGSQQETGTIILEWEKQPIRIHWIRLHIR